MEGELATAVNSIIKAGWELRDGHVIPETDDITLGNSGVTLDATVLYADLADSTELAIFDREIAAEVYKAYLIGTTRLIKAAGGEIRSFDGDRVMGVFIGDFKNTSATKAALKINYFFTTVLEPAFLTLYERLKTSPFKFAQSVGIDTGQVRVARAGVRNDNDLIWVGKAPNIAAKLSSIREQGFSTYITEAVFNRLHESAKVFNVSRCGRGVSGPKMNHTAQASCTGPPGGSSHPTTVDFSCLQEASSPENPPDDSRHPLAAISLRDNPVYRVGLAIHRSSCGLIEFRGEKVFSLHPLEALVLCDGGDLNWATYCFGTRNRKPNESLRCLHHESR